MRVENGIGYGIFAVGQVGTNNFQLLNQRVPLTARVTVVNGIPGLVAPVTVQANGASLFTFDYREVVGPLTVLPGNYTFDALVNGTPVLQRSDTVARGDDVTIVAHLDGNASPVLSAFSNDTSNVASGNARVTVRHLAAAPTVDVVVTNAGNPLATIPGLSNGNEAIASLPLGNLGVSIVAGGNVVFGPVNFRPADNISYQFLALGDFAGGSFTVEVVQRDLTPAVPGEIATHIGGWSCGPAIAAEPTTFDYGQPWSVVATGADPGAMAILNFGDSITVLEGVPLPIDISAFGAPSCFLNANVIAQFGAVVDAQGRVEFPFTVPGSLFGGLQRSFFQVGTSTNSNALGYDTSEYLEIF